MKKLSVNLFQSIRSRWLEALLVGMLACCLSFQVSAQQLLINDANTGGATAQSVVNELLGGGNSAVISNISITGDNRCVGTFTGGSSLGSGALGFDSGVVLSSGRVLDSAGPNIFDDTTTEFFSPGDDFLQSLLPGEDISDACIVEFDFECPLGVDTVLVDYVFGSDEYNEFVDAGANDVFGFALNGANIAIIPNSGGLPVDIDNLNCGVVYNPNSPTSPNVPFCDLFINNDLQSGTPTDVNIEADGLTTVLTAEGGLNPGVNHMKFAIGDVLDSSFDSWVFLKGGGFQCDTAPPGGDPKTLTLLSTTCRTYQGTNLFYNEDIVKYDHEEDLFEILFDGSDVGLTYANVDAYSQSDSGDVLISVDETFYIDGIGYVGDEDILRFVPSSLGDVTAGSFQPYFDGSLNGLTYYGNDIDAFHVVDGESTGPGNDDDEDGLLNEVDACPLDPLNDIDGDGLCGNVLIYFSLSCYAYLGGAWYADDDIVLFEEATGTFSKYFNGSSVGLAYTDVNGFKLLDNGDILLSFNYGVVLPSLGEVRDEDVVRFMPTSLGENTTGNFVMHFDGSSTTLQGYYVSVDAVHQIVE